MSKPLILLTPQNMPMEAPFLEHYTYSNTFNSAAILRAGGLPVIPPYLTKAQALELMAQADGLFMTGGNDIDPALYGEPVHPACETLEPARDASDLALLQAALHYHKPVLCVCRGTQLTNVYYGGSLWQDIPSQVDTAIHHAAWDTREEYEGEQIHTVRVERDTPLYRLLGEDSFGVNSLHHQGIRTLGEGLKPMAFAEDGIVESYYLPGDGQWLRAYQWHPEMQVENAHNIPIFQDFIRACRENKEENP